MNIGAGTVINISQAKKAVEVGAKFLVSLGLSEDVAVFARENKIPYYPGTVTPTEIMRAIDLGINVVKFFPANVYGGLNAIKALSGPFPQLKFIPTGGVSEENLAEFLENDKIFTVGGSWMMKGYVKANCERIGQIVKGINK